MEQQDEDGNYVLNPIEDGDMDSLFALPLHLIPIQTPALRQARLIKNVRLQSVVEVFQHSETGSGQLDIEDLPNFFEWEEGAAHPDMELLRALAPLPSYDVYSLRILLRRIGISVDQTELKLSAEKNAELAEYMTQFTRPLIIQIYGDDDMNIQSFEDVVGLFRDPDVKKAREKLKRMADKLEIELEEVPRFLEDYGDIFLSLSYYRQSLDRITPILSDFLNSLDELKKNYQIKNDRNMMQTFQMIENTINQLTAGISGRFENFDRSTQDMWSNLSADRFRNVRKLIESYHTTIGGVLCGLTVKMNAWARRFPKKDVGGPMKRAEFIMSEMKQGIQNIQKIEDSAPMLSQL